MRKVKDQKFGLGGKLTGSQRSLYCFFFFINLKKCREQRKSMPHGVTKCQKSGLQISKRVKQDYYRHFSKNLCLRKQLTTGKREFNVCPGS